MALDPVARKGYTQNQSDTVNLLDAVTATANENWWPCGNFRKFDFSVKGIVSGDVATMYAFFDPGTGEPAATVHTADEALAPTITADGNYELTLRADYLKARLTATAGGGTVTLTCKGSSD